MLESKSKASFFHARLSKLPPEHVTHNQMGPPDSQEGSTACILVDSRFRQIDDQDLPSQPPMPCSIEVIDTNGAPSKHTCTS